MKFVDIEPIVAGWKASVEDIKKSAENLRKIKTKECQDRAVIKEGLSDFLNELANSLEKAPLVKTEDITKKLWTRVEDALPPESEDVLVACADGDRLIAFWQSSCGEERKPDWMESRECIPLDDVTHWMWIPEPPKGEQK